MRSSESSDQHERPVTHTDIYNLAVKAGVDVDVSTLIPGVEYKGLAETLKKMAIARKTQRVMNGETEEN